MNPPRSSVPLSLSRASALAPVLFCAFALPSCESGKDTQAPPVSLVDSRTYRAIAGVSMGAYGALNIGTKRVDEFGTIASLGGPVDMQELLRHAIRDNLDVSVQTAVPTQVGQDFTFDKMPPYPDRDTRISMLQDLVIAFGNPFLHHTDPARQYLAIDSQPALLGMDDVVGMFAVNPALGPRGFMDGGDGDQNGVRSTAEMAGTPVDVLLAAAGTASARFGGARGAFVGGRELFDVDGDELYDVGDTLVVNYSEPFTDLDGDLVFEPADGETFDDFGLDGVAGTLDFGEGSGEFEYDPDRARWIAEDPYSRLAAQTAAQIGRQRLYLEVGDDDEFGLAAHYDRLVAMLESKGVPVIRQTLQASCTSVPNMDQPAYYVQYDGGHIGIPASDDISDVLRAGDFCGQFPIWRRLLSMIGFLNESFPNGDYGPGGIRVVGDLLVEDVRTPQLETDAVPLVTRKVVVYRPPSFFNTDRLFPIVYFFGGYGQDPDDYERMRELLDLLIGSGDIQNTFYVFVEGAGGRKGSFFADHAVPHEQVPGALQDSGRYESAFLFDIIPHVEQEMLNNRISR